jgi:hypothetical protein
VSEILPVYSKVHRSSGIIENRSHIFVYVTQQDLAVATLSLLARVALVVADFKGIRDG